MKKKIFLYLLLVFIWSIPAYSAEVFYDNFNDGIIDTINWPVTGGDGVFEQNGLLKVEANTTDDIGRIYSKWIEINPKLPITITTRSKIHYSNDYFIGGLNITQAGHL